MRDAAIGLLLYSWLAGCLAAADRFEQVVFTKGADGYFAFRIPALVVAADETLLAFCEGRKTSLSDDGDNDLVLRRSRDGGRTWLPLQLVHEEGGDAVITIGNPCPVVDRETGVVWLLMNRKNGRVLITRSEDHGASWSPAKDITSQTSKPGWGWYALGPGVGIQIERGPHQGRLVIPANHRLTTDRSGPSSSHVIYSDDHGQSWQIGGDVGLHTNECQVVETLAADRSELLINARNHWARSGNHPELAGVRIVARSRDGGQSWQEPGFDTTLIEPACQASLVRYTWPGEGHKSVLLFSNPANTRSRAQMTMRASFDEGRSWPVSKEIYAGSSAYSCLAPLADGGIGLLYERDNYKELVFTRFSLQALVGR
jgi:sialidase-1